MIYFKNDVHRPLSAKGRRAAKRKAAAEARRREVRAKNRANKPGTLDFDLFALKQNRAVQIRVKTCGPRQNAFQFSFRPGQSIPADNFAMSDFTILVKWVTIVRWISFM
jgi:hypothetical protein